jgi:hypothetical protein
MFGLDAPAVGGRLAWIATGLLVGLLSAPAAYAQAQAPAAAQPAAQAAPVTRTFGPDAGLVLFFVKPDKTKEFEGVMDKLKEALQKAEKPERKQQAASWKLYKSPDPAGPNTLYVFVIDPAVKGADYTVGNILFDAFPKEAAEIYKQFADSLAQGMNLVNLAVIQEFGK